MPFHLNRVLQDQVTEQLQDMYYIWAQAHSSSQVHDMFAASADDYEAVVRSDQPWRALPERKLLPLLFALLRAC